MIDHRRDDARPRNEAAGGDEVGMDPRDPVVERELAPRAIERRLPQRRVDDAAARARDALRTLQRQRVDRPEHEARVGAGYPVVIAALDPVGVHEPHGRLPDQIPPDAQDVIDGMIGACERRSRAVHPEERAEIRSRYLARQLHGDDGLHQPARVDERIRRVELLQPLEEERTLLREKQCLAWVELQLARIRFHLREIGIPGAGEGQVVADSPAHVATERGAGRRVVPSRWILGGSVRLPGRLGIEIENEPAAQVVQPGQRAGLPQERRGGPPCGRPRVLVPRVLHLPDDVQPPVLCRGALVAQALERDADFDLVSVIGDAALRLVDEVSGQVHRVADRAPQTGHAGLGALVQHAVGLNAEGVHAEHDRLAVVVERVEQDLHVVVGGDLVPVGEGGMYGTGRLEGTHAEVDRAARVPHQHFRRVFRGTTVNRCVLREPGEPGGLAPLRLVEPAVDRHRPFELRDLDAKLAIAAGVAGRQAAGLQGGDEREHHAGRPI